VWVPGHALYVSLEDFLGRSRALDGHRLAHPAKGDRGQEGGVLALRLRGTSGCTRSPFRAQPYRGAREVCTPISSLRTPAARGRPPQIPSPARRSLGTRLVRRPFGPLFAGGTDPSYGAGHGGAAHRNPAHGLHVIATLPEGDERTLLEVSFEELAEPLIDLGPFAGCLARFQRLSPSGLGGVTLDGRDADPEGAGRLGALGMPRPMATTIFLRRSLEYAFIGP
jgi:hypothetical protein